jgi:deazaflavin-dependent oxidoreductase (nitroreductase family)
MADAARKRAVGKFVGKWFVNPVVRALVRLGVMPTHAILETTGRKSGEPRQIPIGNGLRGDDFWIVTEHGYHAAYVKNIQANPHVRVKVGRRWYTGVAEILPDDDPEARMRWLGRPLNDAVVRLIGTEQLTIRIHVER